MLFIGSYVGLQFYKGTLNTPTSSSSTNPVVRNIKTFLDEKSNIDLYNNEQSEINNFYINSASNTIDELNLKSQDDSQSQKHQILISNGNPTNSLVNEQSFENLYSNKNLGSQSKNLPNNYVYQTSTTNDATTTNNIVNSADSNSIEKACLDKAYTYLNTSFVVIGGVILFVNGIF